jgi:hypothetical protein
MWKVCAKWSQRSSPKNKSKEKSKFAKTYLSENHSCIQLIGMAATVAYAQWPPADHPHFRHHAATPCCHLKYLSLHWTHNSVLNSRLNLHLQHNWVLKMTLKSYPETYVHTQPNTMAMQQNALLITFIIQSNPEFPK